MIAFFKGVLVEKNLTRAVVDVNSIGFELLIPMSTYDVYDSANQWASS